MTAKTVLIPVPSGRLLFGNDLRPLTGHVKAYSLNTVEGLHAMSLQYSLYGVAHIYMGDTAPAVIKVEDGLHLKTGDHPEAVGAVKTSLSWYSAMDADIFAQRCTSLGVDPDTFEAFTVDVKPGAYALTFENADYDERGVVVSKISWVDIPCDLLPQDEPDFRFAETFEKSAIWKHLRSLSGGINSAVEFTFTVLGNAINWHHGHLVDLSGHAEDTPFRKRLPKSADVDADLARVPELPGFVPGLNMPVVDNRSYPISPEYPKLGKAPLNADPHALAVGMMFIKSRLQHAPNLLGDSEEETANFHDQLKREFAVAVKIADTRGLFKDGTMDKIFGEIIAAWAPTPESALEM